MRDREGKSGYMVWESTYREKQSTFSPARSVQDVRDFPGLHQIQIRVPFPGISFFSMSSPVFKPEKV